MTSDVSPKKLSAPSSAILEINYPHPEPQTFGELLKWLREERFHHISQEEVANRIVEQGFSENTRGGQVSDWEIDEHLPSSPYKRALEAVFHVDGDPKLRVLWERLYRKKRGTWKPKGPKKGKTSQVVLARQADAHVFPAPGQVYFYDDSDLLSLVTEFRKAAFGQLNSAEVNTAFNHVLAAIADFIIGQAYFPEMKDRLVGHVLAHFREDDNFSRIVRDYVLLLSHAEKNALLEHGYVAARVLPKLQHADQRRVTGGLLDAMAWATLSERRWDQQDQEAAAPLADELCRLIAEGAASGVIAASALVQLTAADEVNRARYRLHESQAGDLEGMLLTPLKDEILGLSLIHI